MPWSWLHAHTLYHGLGHVPTQSYHYLILYLLQKNKVKPTHIYIQKQVYTTIINLCV